MRNPGRAPRVLAAAALAAAAASACMGGDGAEGVAAPAPGYEVTWTVPQDLAPDADLAAAAQFAWQEFFALNWPAVPQTGAPGTRDTPDTTALFGAGSGPLVWHTFRSKVEIFPPRDSVPNGYVDSAGVSFGYDAAPRYAYGVPVAQPAGGGAVPWINLDENDEIGQDAMFAGVASQVQPLGGLILFLAKANRAEYTYVAGNRFFQEARARPAQAASARFVGDSMRSPPAGDSAVASLPTGTIEIKAAWRQLAPGEDSTRFYRTRVRYYASSGAGGALRAVDTTMVLVALHIIHKTPSQPHFVYASFEQGDNLLDSIGNPVEEVDGTLRPAYASVPPTTALVRQTPARASVADTGYTPATVQTVWPDSSGAVPGKRVYYRNSPGLSTTRGVVALNRRDHAIPAEIIAANRSAQAAISAYDSARGVTGSPWRYYKLVNVQSRPIDKPAGQPYAGADSATYYMANSVLESNVILQEFSGQFQPGFVYGADTTGFTGLITDWCGQNAAHPQPLVCAAQPNGPFHNVSFAGQRYNMGGCMGCHGNAQVAGSDFSFILGEVNTTAPQVADTLRAADDVEKFFRIFGRVRAPDASAAAAVARSSPARPPAPPPTVQRRR